MVSNILGSVGASRPTTVRQNQAAQFSGMTPLADSSPADQVTLKAKAPRFGGPLDKNHSIVLPFDVEMDLDPALQAQRALLMKDIEKAGLGDKKSHTTVFMDTFQDLTWPASSAGFADTLTMALGKTDVVIPSTGTAESLRPLLSAPGKRFMYPNTLLEMGPMKGVFGGTTDLAGSDTRWFNEYQRNLEALVMHRTGKTNRAEVNRDLNSGVQYNSLTSLAYGTKGLVDAIIVSADEVLSRPVLDEYYKQASPRLDGKKNQKAREAFNAQTDSLEKVVTWARENGKLQKLAKFSPKSITPNAKPLYKSATTEDGTVSTDGNQDEAKKLLAKLTKLLGVDVSTADKADTSKAGDDTEATDSDDDDKPQFYTNGGEAETELDRRTELSQSGGTSRVEIAQVPAGLSSTLLRDSIYFPQAFGVEEGKQMTDALHALFDKKEQQRAAGQPTQNILLVDNSPGGAVAVLGQMRSALDLGNTPVDVMVQGMGASCGALILAAATGNRLITPNSDVLLHEVRTGRQRGNLSTSTESARGMKYMNDEATALVAKKSGRDLDEVREDFRNDFWVNPVESAVYGPKGLVDGIVVGPDKVIPRQAVFDFIVEKKGSVEKAQQYIDNKFVERRKGRAFGDIQSHQEVNEDPMANPVDLIRILTERGKAVSMKKSEQFKASAGDVAGDANKTMDLFYIQEGAE